jgi:hypothetical protein
MTLRNVVALPRGPAILLLVGMVLFLYQDHTPIVGNIPWGVRNLIHTTRQRQKLGCSKLCVQVGKLGQLAKPAL